MVYDPRLMYGVEVHEGWRRQMQSAPDLVKVLVIPRVAATNWVTELQLGTTVEGARCCV
jgi:hypothetical protein